MAPGSTHQFMVEVDVSEVGVGAVLSQRAVSDNKMHPCAFLSHGLSPVKRNYNIGNRELLAVKLALEEWHHWLEGSGVPFIVWTDHKNLEYIRSAKCLNSRQARCFSVVSISPSSTAQVLRILSPTRCHAFLIIQNARRHLSALYTIDWLSLRSLGRSS